MEQTVDIYIYQSEALTNLPAVHGFRPSSIALAIAGAAVVAPPALIPACMSLFMQLILYYRSTMKLCL